MSMPPACSNARLTGGEADRYHRSTTPTGSFRRDAPEAAEQPGVRAHGCRIQSFHLPLGLPQQVRRGVVGPAIPREAASDPRRGGGVAGGGTRATLPRAQRVPRSAAGQLHHPVRDGLLRGPQGVSAAGRLAEAVPPARERGAHAALHGGAVHARRPGGPVRGGGARGGGAQSGARLRARLRSGLGARRLHERPLGVRAPVLPGGGRDRREPEPGALVHRDLYPRRLLLRRRRHLAPRSPPDGCAPPPAAPAGSSAAPTT